MAKKAIAIQNIEGGAILNGRHLVTYESGALGGSLPKNPATDFHSGVRDRFEGAKDIGTLRRITCANGESSIIKGWGRDNQLPLRLDEAVRANHILPSLLDTKRKILLGQRSYMYYERWENDDKGTMVRIIDEEPMPSEIEDFFAASDEHRYFHQTAAQINKNGNVLTEMLPESGQSGRIGGLKAHEAKFWRKGQMDSKGIVQKAFFKGDAWNARNAVGASKQFPIESVSLWNGLYSTDTAKRFLHWTGDAMFSPDDYYFSTIWAGSLPWSALMDIIPLFHDNNLKHRYQPSFHIRLRKGMFLDSRYFRSVNEKEKAQYLKDEDTARTAWLANANAVLAGYENAGRAIWSEEEYIKGAQKHFPDVEIIPLNINMNDEALLKLQETAVKAVSSSVQIHPTLANVEPTGRAASGTEMRNATLMQRLIHTPLPRQIILEPIYVVSKVNEWHIKYAKGGRPPKFGFVDEDIVALNIDKTGSQPVTP
jgi:hypothetical protein